MNSKNKFKLVKKAICSSILLGSLVTSVGCYKEHDCDIEGKHVHVYVNDYYMLSRYVESEKESVGILSRTDNYLPMTDELKIISENNLYMVVENLDYLTERINLSQPKRQAYVYGYYYGTYTGYDYGYNYNISTGNYEYSYYYGTHTGYHYDYEWQDIQLDEYTTDKVRDVTYVFRFYKINEDGTVSSKLFDTLDEVPSEYKYFIPTEFVVENISDSYYLEKELTKTY